MGTPQERSGKEEANKEARKRRREARAIQNSNKLRKKKLDMVRDMADKGGTRVQIEATLSKQTNDAKKKKQENQRDPGA